MLRPEVEIPTSALKRFHVHGFSTSMHWDSCLLCIVLRVTAVSIATDHIFCFSGEITSATERNLHRKWHNEAYLILGPRLKKQYILSDMAWYEFQYIHIEENVRWFVPLTISTHDFSLVIITHPDTPEATWRLLIWNIHVQTCTRTNVHTWRCICSWCRTVGIEKDIVCLNHPSHWVLQQLIRQRQCVNWRTAASVRVILTRARHDRVTLKFLQPNKLSVMCRTIFKTLFLLYKRSHRCTYSILITWQSYLRTSGMLLLKQPAATYINIGERVVHMQLQRALDQCSSQCAEAVKCGS